MKGGAGRARNVISELGRVRRGDAGGNAALPGLPFQALPGIPMAQRKNLCNAGPLIDERQVRTGIADLEGVEHLTEFGHGFVASDRGIS